MIKYISLIISTSIFFITSVLSENIKVFAFTEAELKDLKVKKVKGLTTYVPGSNENGTFLKAEAEGKGSGLGK